MGEKDEIPKFLRLRGCINCEVSKYHKERTGYDYGFDHEAMGSCYISNSPCAGYSVTLSHPFYDPEELLRLAREQKVRDPKIIAWLLGYCLEVRNKFGGFYQKIEVNLDDVIAQIRALEQNPLEVKNE